MHKKQDKEREILNNFTEAMFDKIVTRRDRYVPMAWATMDTKRLIMLLKQEVKELEEGDKRDEALDVANYAMFIWYLNDTSRQTIR